MSCDEELATGACGTLKTERLRYFTGRHMTARDFEDEQAYHRSRRLLHNRMLHGWGIVCGLHVRPDPRPECRTQRVVVRCGMAIDCCGRELVVRRDVVTDIIPWGKRPQVEGGNGGADPRYVLLLCLEYCEAQTEKVPVLYNEAACANPAMEFGRVREGVRFSWHWVTRDQLGANGWRTREGCAPETDHGEPPCDAPDSDCCLDAGCPDHHCVPLAVLTEDVSATGNAPIIDESGRRPLEEGGGGQLTHICWTNWEHGGIVSPSMLAKMGSLRVRFDRDLEMVVQPPGSRGPRGVNPCTFLVEYGEIYEDMDFLPYDEIPSLAPDRRTAVYKLRDPDPGLDGPYDFLVGHTVLITIKCEFLLDCEGHAVDGNHIGGRLPTGNGTPGGTFESWFTVVSDASYDRLTKGEPARNHHGYTATEEAR
jgi:hypothetical protein